MQDIVDLARYPIDQPGSPEWQSLVADCQQKLDTDGLFNLPKFLLSKARQRAVSELKPLLRDAAYTHAREHNIYFKPSIEGLPSDHPALHRFQTVNHTVCADQMGDAIVIHLYEWPDLATFLATVMGKTTLYTMTDPMARVNVMAYRDGEALNWHFDRSEFTTTLLLQSPHAGGEFEYAKNLRSDDDPNYDGVAELLEGEWPTTLMPLEAGTLNVFCGKNTAHRVTPVDGNQERIIAVFSYYERTGVTLSEDERRGFYGRPY